MQKIYGRKIVEITDNYAGVTIKANNKKKINKSTIILLVIIVFLIVALLIK